jgi:hypothetical protein
MFILQMKHVGVNTWVYDCWPLYAGVLALKKKSKKTENVRKSADCELHVLFTTESGSWKLSIKPLIR